MAICDRGICFCMGKDLEVKKRKDWYRMEGCYDFEGNRGMVLEIDSETEISESNNEVGCARLPPDGIWCINLLWGRGQSCLCKKTSTPDKKNMATMVPWNTSPIVSCYPTSARGPLSHIWNCPWSSLNMLSSPLHCHCHQQRSCSPHQRSSCSYCVPITHS